MSLSTLRMRQEPVSQIKIRLTYILNCLFAQQVSVETLNIHLIYLFFLLALQDMFLSEI